MGRGNLYGGQWLLKVEVIGVFQPTHMKSVVPKRDKRHLKNIYLKSNQKSSLGIELLKLVKIFSYP